ncbi:MAG: hypothetical protein WB392_07915 [Methanotrichaceae archaeon]
MDFELYPIIILRSRSFKVLYVFGNYSSIRSSLDRRFETLEVRRAFIIIQLMIILEELIKNADRAFYFDEGPRAKARVVAMAIPKTSKSQITLEAFS